MRSFSLSVSIRKSTRSFARFNLAQLNSDQVESLYSHERFSDRPDQRPDLGRLKLELRKIKTRGFAVTQGLAETGVVAIGVPVRNMAGEAIAGLSMSLPSVRFDPAGVPEWVAKLASAAAAIEAVQITARLPRVHGAPVHLGHPHDLGIEDLMRPDYGDATEVLPQELPVFWACGVTPQAVVQQAQLPIVITHAPGAMLVTDLLNHQLMSH
jgi:hypothetical protein